ncbi:MAG: GNAT family N-acetyltransferase [Magnetovibrionaceae bacterium]
MTSQSQTHCFREPESADLDWMVALNKRFEVEMSPMDRSELEEILEQAVYRSVPVEAPAGFLIAIAPGAAYQSPNYRWFSDRYDAFVYVDRIVTDPAFQGRGIARGLYEDLFSRTAELGLKRICCEVNVDPPNPGSDAFHAAMGFQVVGEAELPGGKKRVRYFVREVA